MMRQYLISHFWVFPALLVALVGCGSVPSEELATVAQAATFPADSEWAPVYQNGSGLVDGTDDGSNANGRQIVGSTAEPAGYIYSDATDFMFRLRLDTSPLSGGLTGSWSNSGWGAIIDTDGDFSAFEFLVVVDASGGNKNVVVRENTDRGATGDPSEVAEVVLSEIPIDLGAGGNVRVSVAGNTFPVGSPDPDYFLDMAVPLTVLLDAGIKLNEPLRLILASSTNGDSMSVDLAGTPLDPGVATIGDTVSDPTYLDGTDADADGDGVLGPNDLDDDNDGIPDTKEGIDGIDPDADNDGEGIPNSEDADDRGDGTAPGCADTDGNGICDVPAADFDSDGDGIMNHLDLDSDNDGVPDVVEAGYGQFETDGDGMVDGEVGFNGLLDALESSPDNGELAHPPLDTDRDSTPDFLDLDSDGDAEFDLNESTAGADADGRLDLSADPDNDGLMDVVDDDDSTYGYPLYTLPDSDSDSIPDPYDYADSGSDAGDSDSDALLDDAECAGGWPCPDSNNNGTPDYMEPDVDNDGDGVTTSFDKDDTNRYVCRDLDDDTCDDCSVLGTTDPSDDGTDTDDDGTCDAGEDNDGDGVPYALDSDDSDDTVCANTDADGCDDCALSGPLGNGAQPDNDGPDADEDGQCDTGDVDDTDSDGVADDEDIDDDNDGLRDEVEGSDDVDDDSNSNSVDTDSDGDGVPDQLEATDENHDGVAERGPSGTDENVNGLDDAFDPDQGGTALGDELPDTNGDGVPDYLDSDDDGDGLLTTNEDLDGDGDVGNDDTDDDGHPNYLDPDDDGDGKATADEQADPDWDGDPSDAVASLDPDLPDYLNPSAEPLDSDGDGLPDVEECLNGNQPDADRDGKPNCEDADDDGDGVPTIDEGADSEPPQDTDDDGKPDYLDADDDGDKIATKDEVSDPDHPSDADEDGTPDYLDPDTDAGQSEEPDAGPVEEPDAAGPTDVAKDSGLSLAGGGFRCSTSPMRGGRGALVWLLVAGMLLAVRRRR